MTHDGEHNFHLQEIVDNGIVKHNLNAYTRERERERKKKRKKKKKRDNTLEDMDKINPGVTGILQWSGVKGMVRPP